jgi:hypothetical protein
MHRFAHPRSALLLLALVSVLVGGAAARAATPVIDVVFNGQGGLTVTYDGSALGGSSASGTVIPAGSYNVIVDNSLGDVGITFQLSGPGVSVITDVDGGESATETWPVTLAPNSTYTYQNASQPGSSEMFGTSAATSPTTAPAPTTTTTAGAAESNGVQPTTTTAGATTHRAATPPPPLRGALTATVSAAGALSLAEKGKPVASLPAGRYTVTVGDHSRTSGFTMQELRDPALTLTSAAFVGVRTTTVTLTVGQWVYYPSFLGAKTYFIVLS